MTNLPFKKSDFLHKTVKQVVCFFIKCYEKASGKLTDKHCGNEIIRGYLGVQNKGLKREI